MHEEHRWPQCVCVCVCVCVGRCRGWGWCGNRHLCGGTPSRCKSQLELQLAPPIVRTRRQEVRAAAGRFQPPVHWRPCPHVAQLVAQPTEALGLKNPETEIEQAAHGESRPEATAGDGIQQQKLSYRRDLKHTRNPGRKLLQGKGTSNRTNWPGSRRAAARARHGADRRW